MPSSARQRDMASTADTSGPLLVIAGAGSGKTNTLAHRVAHLIVSGADPHRILLLTFSRRAAAEMERRVAGIVSAALGERWAAVAQRRCPGRAPSTASARACCASTPRASASTRRSPSSTAATPPT